MRQRYRAIIQTALALLLLCLLATLASAVSPALHTDSGIYKFGDTVGVIATGLPGNKYDWVTIVTAGAPDTTYGQWFHTEGAREGTYYFNGLGPGRYEARLYLDWPKGGYTVAARYTFLVEPASQGPAAQAPAIKPTLKIESTALTPGQSFRVAFTAPATYPNNAWVGILPSNIPHGSEAVNDNHELSFRYLEKATSGVLDFQAPEAPGSYDLRMHDTDSSGAEVAYVTFTVSAPLLAVTLTTDKSAYSEAEPVTVQYSGMPGNEKDFIAAVLLMEDGKEGESHWGYTSGARSGSLAFTGLTPGQYEARAYVPDARGGTEIKARRTFTVKPVASAQYILDIKSLNYKGSVELDGSLVYRLKPKPGIQGSYNTRLTLASGQHILHLDYKALATDPSERNLTLRIQDGGGTDLLSISMQDEGGMKNFSFTAP